MTTKDLDGMVLADMQELKAELGFIGTHLVDSHILRSNPRGELAEISDKRCDYVGDPLPDEGTSSD